ncbi:MAG: GNAT family N-acetyltransferase [Alphaproteobacteria bacterium]
MPARVRILDAIADVPAAAWDACAGADNPFLGHAFLSALEDSRSVAAEAGWLPRHVVVEDEAGTAIGAAPAYVKGHSYGEYVFDHGWAQAYERAGGRYYPKLLVAVPFTPVPGPRLLLHPEAVPETREVLIETLLELAKTIGASSVHANFVRHDEWEALAARGFLRRMGQQFHWTNAGYGSFDDFLAALSSRKRKQIRKERQAPAAEGIVVRALTGDEITARHWDAFHRFYLATADKKWGYAYLERDFFHRLGAGLGDKVVLVVAERGGRPVAGALNLRGTDTLYGRNWGTTIDAPFLHFECCYYQAIDYAIAHGLARVEAGAQGMHKIQRGYLPVATYSAHWIADPGLRRGVADFLDRERPAMAAEMAALAEHSPYRKDGEG